MRDLEIKSEVEHKVLEQNGYSIHYFVSGGKHKETIIFLHPAFGDHKCFDKQVDFFSQNYKVITVDLLGHGLSKVGKSSDKMDASAKHINEILEIEKVEKSHIAGVSMGSLIAQYFALNHSDKVLSLTILGGYNINDNNKEVAKSQRNETFKWLFKAIFSMDSFRKYIASVTLIDKVEQARFYESARSYTRKSFRVMSGLGKIISQRDNVQRTCPLLILSGDKDLEFAIKISAKWHENEPESLFFIIEEAGHCANMDNSVRFNEILLDFITNKRLKLHPTEAELYFLV